MVTSVAVCGSINFDEIAVLPRSPHAHEKVPAHRWWAGLGGSAANTSTWLTDSLPVRFFGTVGDDDAGRACRDALATNGVDASGLRCDPGRRTGRGWSWVTGADKRIVTWHDPSARPVPPDPASCQGPFTHVHLASGDDAWLASCLERLEVVPDRTVSVEFNGRRHETLRALADIGFMNDDELSRGFGQRASSLSPTDVAGILPHPGATLIVTDKGRGVWVCTSQEVRMVPVTPVALDQIVDRTGAGDAFDGGFLACWLMGGTPAESVASGHAAARTAMSQLGGSRKCL